MAEQEHWSLMLLDTYILYNAVYLVILICFSAVHFKEKGVMNYILHVIGRTPFGVKKDFKRFQEHQRWWDDEGAKNRVATQAGGGNKYSIKTWTCVLLFSVFLFILAILFPSKTIDNFSTVTMPSMFRDTILDTNKSDGDKLKGLFGLGLGGGKDKYTVSKNDEDDIIFIRKNAENYEKSNQEPFSVANATKEWDRLSNKSFKKVCGNKTDATKKLNEDTGKCEEDGGVRPQGWKCHNLSKSPCCQRYCPAENPQGGGNWGTYYAGERQGEEGKIIKKDTLKDRFAKDWQCNTESTWNSDDNTCRHVTDNLPTDPIYVLVSGNGLSVVGGGGGGGGGGDDRVSNNLVGDVTMS